MAALLTAHPQADIGTLATPIDSLAELMDPNAVKVVSDARGRALYFSRAPIPWNREGAAAGLASQRDFSGARRHIGLYAYRVGALLRLATLPLGQLEAREKLEQLRALEHGFNIQVAEAARAPGAGCEHARRSGARRGAPGAGSGAQPLDWAPALPRRGPVMPTVPEAPGLCVRRGAPM